MILHQDIVSFMISNCVYVIENITGDHEGERAENTALIKHLNYNKNDHRILIWTYFQRFIVKAL